MTAIFVDARPPAGRAEPYIQIEIWGAGERRDDAAPLAATAYVCVSACVPGLAPAHYGGVAIWPVIDHNSPRPWRDTGVAPTRQALLDHGMAAIPDAEAAIAAMPAIWEAWPAVQASVDGADASTRAAYESACAALGGEAIDDTACSTWGNFTFPDYRGPLERPFSAFITARLQQRRAFQLQREAEKIQADRMARERAEWAADLAAARAAPVQRTFVTVLPGRRDIGEELFDGVELQTIVATHGPAAIDEDAPSIWGSGLLGHEGETGTKVEIAVRPATRA